MEEDKPKGNKLDLILNSNHTIVDYQGLRSSYYHQGNLYLGGKQAVSGQIVEAKSIGAILTIMDQKSYEKQKMKDKVASLGLLERHLLLQIKDKKQENIQPLFAPAFQFIEDSLKRCQNILIHCKGGMSRSPAVLCSFIMKKYGLPFSEAQKILKERRNVVQINQGFRKQLQELEKKKNQK